MAPNGSGSSSALSVPDNFEILVAHTEAQAFRLARLLTESDAEAEKILTQVFAKVCERFADGTLDEQDIPTWIFTHVIEATIAKGESARLSVEHLSTLTQGLQSSDDSRNSLKNSLAQLPAEEQRGFLLHDVLGVPVEKIASVLRLSETRVRHVLYRARTVLRRQLRRSDDAQAVLPSRAILRSENKRLGKN